MRTLNNTVIKNLTPEMGKRIIKKYKDDGWDVSSYSGSICQSNGWIRIYYGVIDGVFSCHSLEQVNESKARIIELDEWQPVRGERVLGWYDDPLYTEERIYLATIEGTKYPIITVTGGDESKFENGELFNVSAYKHMTLIKPVNTELAELEAKYRELGEKIEQLKNKQTCGFCVTPENENK